MIDISIAILAHEDDTIPYLDCLETLMRQYSTELIIINETAISPTLPYSYRTLNLDHNQLDLLSSVMKNSTGDRILILESGYELTEPLIDFITDHIKENSPDNITCTVKSYLTSSLELTYEHTETILYHRSTKVSSVNYEKESLLDYSLLHSTIERFPFYVRKFIKQEDTNSLLVWFHDFTKPLDSNEIDQCYTILEQIKRLDSDHSKEFDLTYQKLSKKDSYSQYLSCISYIQNGQITDKAFIRYMKHFERKRCCFDLLLPDAARESLYFAWLIKDIFILKDAPLPFLSYIKAARLQQLLAYLLETDPLFSRILQSFLEKEVLCAKKKKEVEALFTIYHTCLDYLARQIESVKERDLVLRLYAQYKVMAKYYIRKYHQFRHIFLSYQEEEMTLFYYNQAYLRYTSRQFPYRLSICMTVKNQEQKLKQCLASLRPLLSYDFAELIIVDTGSYDRTISIASSYTLNVYFYTGKDDNISARNQSIMYARGEYFMILDACETLSASDCKELIDFFSSFQYKNQCTYSFDIAYSAKDSSDSCTTMSIKEPRIFQNDGTIYYTRTNPDQPGFQSDPVHLDITIQHGTN